MVTCEICGYFEADRWGGGDPASCSECRRGVDVGRLVELVEHDQVVAHQGEGERLRSHARAAATRRAYRQDWKLFRRWCERRGECALPASAPTVERYLEYLSALGRAYSTACRSLASIAVAHQVAQHADPTKDARVRDARRGYLRTAGAVQRKAAALYPDQVRAYLEQHLVRQARSPWDALRSRALLVVGLSIGARCSELEGLDRMGAQRRPEGYVLQLAPSKTSARSGTRDVVELVYGAARIACPVRALDDWLGATGLERGPVFVGLDHSGELTTRRMKARSVDRLVRRVALALGLEGTYSAHSLRSGFVTHHKRQGTPDALIKQQGRWRTSRSLDEYFREATRFRDALRTF